MPGAYEKVMNSIRYKGLLKRINDCNELIKGKKYDLLMKLHLPLLIEEVGEEKEDIEEFFYAGGMLLLCKILILRSKEKQIKNIEEIINFFNFLLCKQHETYDEDINEIPLLTYFLCERNKYYVDIHWNSNELILMQTYINANLSIINTNDEEEEKEKYEYRNDNFLDSSDCSFYSDNENNHYWNKEKIFYTGNIKSGEMNDNINKKNATMYNISNGDKIKENKIEGKVTDEIKMKVIEILLVSLITYPQHRVVENIINCFDVQSCCNFLKSLKKMNVLFYNEINRKKVVQLLCAISSLGLGMYITKEIFNTTLLCCLHRNLLNEDIRCTCSDCELSRKLRKIGRERDELGVCTESNSKKFICFSLLNADVSSLIIEILYVIKNEQININKRVKLNILQNCFMDEEEHEFSSFSKVINSNNCVANHVININNDNRGTNLNNNNNRYIKDFIGKVRENETTKEWICYLIMLLNITYSNNIRNSDDFIFTKAKNGNILCANDYSLLSSLLSIIDLSDVRFFFNVKKCKFYKSIRCILNLLCTSVLINDNLKEKEVLCERLYPIIKIILIKSTENIIFKTEDKKNWLNSFFDFPTYMCAMMQIVYLHNYFIQLKEQKNSKKIYNKSNFNNDNLDTYNNIKEIKIDAYTKNICITACESLYECYECNMKKEEALDKVNQEKNIKEKKSYNSEEHKINFSIRSVNLRKVFLKNLLICMCILVGGIEYSKTTPSRRRFLPPPNILCAYMNNIGKSIIYKHNNLCINENCIIVKHIANIVISRAEKSGSLFLLNNKANYRDFGSSEIEEETDVHKFKKKIIQKLKFNKKKSIFSEKLKKEKQDNEEKNNDYESKGNNDHESEEKYYESEENDEEVESEEKYYYESEENDEEEEKQKDDETEEKKIS